MKRLLSLLLTVVFLLTGLSACGDGAGPAVTAEREQVTVALWSDQLTERYTSYLQSRFPEVDFTFYVATNSADFYRFKMERGDLPDILTVRRFALRDVSDWRDQLLDLSDTELANTFPQSYLRSYTYSDGTVNWLPTCAEIDSIVVNRALFDELGISVPTNYQSFVEACTALTEQGIRPFLSNFSADFTCMEILQGLSISQLNSLHGREWRQQYESGQADQLSEEVWLPVFQRMAEFLDCTGITAGDLALGHTDVLTAFQNGELGMMRGTGNEEAIRGSVNGKHLLMPYFGETEQENWYLTYPAFQIAANARGTEDPARKQLILDIMTAMLDQDGQENIASGQNMIPYIHGVELELSPELDNMQPYIENNQLYIRLASSDMFSVSQTVVQGMIDGTYPDAHSALDAFNSLMDHAGDSPETAAHIDTGYSFDFDPEHGSQAASAVMNSVREDLRAQLLIAPVTAIAGNITAGDYTMAELSFLTMGEAPVMALCEMTGEQLYKYVEHVLTATDGRGLVVNDSTLYVSSGFEMTIAKTDTGYTLERLTIGGKEDLNREETYSVAVLRGAASVLQEALDYAGVTEYTVPETPYKQLVIDRLSEGRQLAAPTDYITLQ